MKSNDLELFYFFNFLYYRIGYMVEVLDIYYLKLWLLDFLNEDVN